MTRKTFDITVHGYDHQMRIMCDRFPFISLKMNRKTFLKMGTQKLCECKRCHNKNIENISIDAYDSLADNKIILIGRWSLKK